MSENVEAKISGEILADARTKAERALKAAVREKEAAMKDARDAARRFEEETLADAAKRAPSHAKIIKASAEPARRRLELNAHEDVIRGVINDAKAKLIDRSGERYLNLLVALAAEASAMLGGGALVARVNPDDAKSFPGLRVGMQKAENVPGASIEIMPDDGVSSGVIVETADGLRRVNNTIDARLERIYPALRRRAAEALFDTSSQENKPSAK